MNKRSEIQKRVIPIWLVAEGFLFTFYLAFGVWAVLALGPYTHLILFRISFMINYYYPAYAGSLVVFAAFGLVYVWRFKERAVPMLLFVYAVFEVLGQDYKIVDLIIVMIALVGIAGYLIAHPSFNPKPLGLVLLGSSLIATDYMLLNASTLSEFVFEILLLSACLLLFSPRPRLKARPFPGVPQNRTRLSS